MRRGGTAARRHGGTAAGRVHRDSTARAKARARVRIDCCQQAWTSHPAVNLGRDTQPQSRWVAAPYPLSRAPRRRRTHVCTIPTHATRPFFEISRSQTESERRDEAGAVARPAPVCFSLTSHHRALTPGESGRVNYTVLSLARRHRTDTAHAQLAHHGICSTTRYLALPARTLSSIALICDTGASSTCGLTP